MKPTSMDAKKQNPRFIAHYGGHQPVADHIGVEVVFGDGSLGMARSGFLGSLWTGEDVHKDNRVIAYRVLGENE